MRVLVCGDRKWADQWLPDGEPDWKRNAIERDLLHSTLDDLLHATDDPIEIIEGCAKGADTMAGEWGKEHRLMVLEYPAQWHLYGRSAGPIRNRQMLEEGKPDLVLAFHSDFANSKGTKDMVTQARKAGVEVRVYP